MQRIFSPAVLVVASMALLAGSTSADAKTVNPEASAAAMETCMLQDDNQLGDNANSWGCCSHDAGICVICYKPPAADGRDSCNVVPYRATGLKGTRSLTRGQMIQRYGK